MEYLHSIILPLDQPFMNEFKAILKLILVPIILPHPIILINHHLDYLLIALINHPLHSLNHLILRLIELILSRFKYHLNPQYLILHSHYFHLNFNFLFNILLNFLHYCFEVLSTNYQFINYLPPNYYHFKF